MSEHAATAPATEAAAAESHDGHGHGPIMPEMKFEPVEIEQFDTDDQNAGRAIGVMLSLFFIYTILAMSLAAWWTYSSL